MVLEKGTVLALKASIRDGSKPSSTRTLWLSGSGWSSCTNPLGQRMDAFTGPLASPKPKNTSLLCCERKPDPARSVCVCRPFSVSTVIAAPMASRLLLRPRRRKAIEGGRSVMTFFKSRNCGPLRFFRNTSSRPSPSKSARAKALPSSRKSKPTTPETSEKVPSLLFA